MSAQREMFGEDKPAGAIIVGIHRYRLWRSWRLGSGSVCFIMLNPSTADATDDDPTIRRCVGFAQTWGFARLEVVNLFSYRTLSPKALADAVYPNGPHADVAIREAIASSSRWIYAWGTHGLRARAAEVDRMLGDHTPLALAINKDGSPKHPLYCKTVTPPIPLSLEQRARMCGRRGAL